MKVAFTEVFFFIIRLKQREAIVSLGEFASWEKFENFHESPETVFRHNIKHIKVRGQMNFVHLQMPFQVIFHKTLLLIKIIGSALG